MKKILLVILVLSPVLMALGQEKTEEKKFGISFSGFVKNDFFLDTRQTFAPREGHFLLWPSAEVLDYNGDDINAKANLNMLAIQSRITGKISGPDAFGAKTSGVIEGDFFAQATDNINLFRLRHAFIKLNWKNTELLTGQTWNPLFVTGCFPGTVSFNTGTPLQSFARNPQIRLTRTVGDIKIIGALLSQRDYVSKGISGTGATSDYLRNSVVPDLHLQVQYSTKNEDTGTDFLVGAGIAYKTIVPRLSSMAEVTSEVTDSLGNAITITAMKPFSVDEKVSGLTFILYQTLKLKLVTIKLQYRYGENIPDVLAISGFAVKNTLNASTGEQSYTPLKNTTVWWDIHTNGKNIQVGLFGGILMNMGTKEAMSSASNLVYGLGTDIETLLRISPRVIWNSNKFRVALEFEYTSASFADKQVQDPASSVIVPDYDVYHIPISTTTVSNFRTLLSTYYFF